jgi:hypothetical protein
MTNAYEIFVGKPEHKCSLGDTGLDGTLILKFILNKRRVKRWARSVGFRAWRRGVLL